jgi:hypothetical protein
MFGSAVDGGVWKIAHGDETGLWNKISMYPAMGSEKE